MLIVGTLIVFSILICFTIVKSGDGADCVKSVEEDYKGLLEYLER